MCRTTGLRRAAGQHVDDLGGAAYAKRANEELDRLLSLNGKERTDEKKRLPPRMWRSREEKTGALGVVGILFEAYIFTEAASEINKRLVALHGTPLPESLDAEKKWKALSNSSLGWRWGVERVRTIFWILKPS